MKRLALGSVVAAVLMFFWGFLYWAVSPIPLQIMRGVPDEPALSKALAEALPRSGVYVLPHPQGVSQDEFLKRHQAGPLAQILIQTRGEDPMQGSIFFWGFVHMLASAFLLGLVLRAAAPASSSYAARFRIAALAGLAGAMYSNLGRPIWWHQTWDFHLMYFAFDLGSWLLAALALAYFVRDPSSRG